MQNDDMALLNLIADIRAAAGDKTGKLMQDELVAHIAALRADADRFRALEEGKASVEYTTRRGESGFSCEIDFPASVWVRRKDLRTAIDASRAAK